MDWILDLIQQHAHRAHWLVFIGAILAALHIPISIDVLMILSATVAATLVPEHTIHLFVGITAGCLLSAWLSYWIGRTLGLKLAGTRFFSKILSPARIEKIGKFYKKYGLYTLIVGRFIPFGVRNGLFMTSGMSKVPFWKFILRDGLACLIWCTLTFTIFYTVGKNLHVLYNYVKIFNIAIFSILCVTLIAVFWYKKRKVNV